MRDTLRDCWAMLVIGWQHNRLRLSTAVLLTVASGLAWPLAAVGFKTAVNAAVTHSARGAVVAGALTSLGAIGVLVLRHLAFIAYVEITSVAFITLEAELITLVNGSAGTEHHERPKYADKIAVLREELSGLMQGVGGLLAIVSLGVSMGLTGWLLASVSPWLLLLPLAAIPPVVAGRRESVIVDRATERATAAVRQSWHFFQLATSAAPALELRVLRLREMVRQRSAGLWDDAGRTVRAGLFRAAAVVAAGQLTFAVAYAGSVLLVIHQAVVGHRKVGDIVLVVVLAAQVNQQVSSALQGLQGLQRTARGFTRLRWLRSVIADQEPSAPDAAVPERIRVGIEFRGVTFSYPGTATEVLHDVTVRLAAGSTVAIVGENGAGKTTLVKLLCQFHPPSGGSITVDGVDIRRFPIEDWRRRIAVSFQEFVRFELLARHTVGVGDLPNLDDDARVLRALDRARAADVIDGLPDGLNTPLGKNYAEGVELSGGQWQKLALGRAMMRPAPLLLLLDEPTAALDAQAEHALFERYAENAGRISSETGAITVLVSHRFSTVRAADLILVVADGRIREMGDHETLLARRGIYAELYALQAAAYQD